MWPSWNSNLQTLDLQTDVLPTVHRSSEFCAIEERKDNTELFVLRFYPSQPNGVMLSTVNLPNHTFTGQA